jgi:hypothetical protein
VDLARLARQYTSECIAALRAIAENSRNGAVRAEARQLLAKYEHAQAVAALRVRLGIKTCGSLKLCCRLRAVRGRLAALWQTCIFGASAL